jgi:alkylhydroperoxidase family enzyme
MTNQLSPLTEPYEPEVAAVLASYPSQDGYVLGLFRTFANSLRFLKKGVPNLLDKASPLPLRMREIVILRTTANRNCEYEWGVHVAIFVGAAKLSEQQVAATRDASIEVALWSPVEANLLLAIDDLCTTGKIAPEALALFQTHWSMEQQLEIFALCGTYSTISFVANNADLPLEPFGARFPV